MRAKRAYVPAKDAGNSRGTPRSFALLGMTDEHSQRQRGKGEKVR